MATVKVIEQPAKVRKFRYEREGRGGLIYGASSTGDKKTYPKIKVEGYQGRALVIVSCVTKDEPYRPHPHKLVGSDGCRKGVCSIEVSTDTMTAEFTKLGIHCMRIKDIEESLKLRKDIRVDPFRTGFAHYRRTESLDLTAVRLCFQVLLLDEHGDFTIPLTPVVSDPIYDKRVVSDLTIVKISKCVCAVDGKEEIILVCDKVKEDIQIRFYEEQDGKVVWEGFGIFKPSDIYKQVVIWFRPPCYKTLDVLQPVNVFLQLQRPSDGERSDPLPFVYLPLASAETLNHIRQKSLIRLRHFCEKPLVKEEHNIATLFPQSAGIYGHNTQTLDFSNLMDVPQQPYNLPIFMNSISTRPLIPDLPSSSLQFPNPDIDEPSTSSTIRNLNDDDDLSLNQDTNMSSSSQQDYSPAGGLASSITHSPSLINGFIFPNIEYTNTLENCDDKPTSITEIENNLNRSNTSEMETQAIDDLSRLLIGASSGPSELQQLNIDSGELDTMNIST